MEGSSGREQRASRTAHRGANAVRVQGDERAAQQPVEVGVAGSCPFAHAALLPACAHGPPGAATGGGQRGRPTGAANGGDAFRRGEYVSSWPLQAATRRADAWVRVREDPRGRAHVAAAEDSLAVTERRRLKRHVDRVQVYFQSGRTQGRGYIRNLSKGGLFIRAESLPAPGAPVALTIELPSGIKVDLNGTVRWTTAELNGTPQALGEPAVPVRPGFGVRIESDSARYRELFESLLLH